MTLPTFVSLLITSKAILGGDPVFSLASCPIIYNLRGIVPIFDVVDRCRENPLRCAWILGGHYLLILRNLLCKLFEKSLSVDRSSCAPIDELDRFFIKFIVLI